jgi:uncharacterized protein (TIGR00369 family)
MDPEILERGRQFIEWFVSSPDEVAANNPFTARLGFRAKKVSAGEKLAQAHYTVGPDAANFMGIVHGGVLSTILDETACLAAMALVGNCFRGTVNIGITYMVPARPGLLIGDARVLGHTRSLIFLQSSVRSESEELHAHATVTVGYSMAKK